MKSRLPTLLLIALLLAGVAGYTGASLLSIQRARENAAAQNRELAFGPGDLTLRDLPKTQQLLAAQTPAELFDDGQYAGEKNWYPFMTPLVTAMFAKITHQSAAVSLLVVTIGLNAATILAVGALLAYLFGWKGLLALGAGAALNFIGFNNGSYPIGTVKMPFALFIFVLGALFTGPGHIPKNRWMGLFALLGFLHGLIGLWQGSSFIVASVLGAVLIIRWLWLARSERGPALATIAVYGLITCALFGLLIVPQLLHYGRYTSGSEARLYLATQYGKGDNFGAFASLAFFSLPAGLNSLPAIAFLSLLIRNANAKTKSMAWVLLLAYLFASFMASLGYVQNSTQVAWLGQLIRAAMPTPAHTFGYVAEFCLSLMRVAGLGVILAWLMDLLARTVSARLPQPALAVVVSLALVAIAMLPLVLRYSQQETNFSLTVVDKEITQFAAQAAKLVPPNATVYGAESVMQYAPFKILVGSAPHANPYAQPAREDAKGLLTDQDLVASGDATRFAQTLKDFSISHAVVSSNEKAAFLRLCDGQQMLASSGGKFELIKFSGTCAYPSLGAAAPLTPAVSAQNAMLNFADGHLDIGIVDSSAGYALANLPPLPVASRELVGIRVRGQAETSTCLIVGGLFHNAAQNKEVDRASVSGVVSHTFEFTGWVVAPANVDQLVPVLALDPACAPSTQTVRVDSLSIARKPLP